MPEILAADARDALRRVVHPLANHPSDYDPLLDQIGDAPLVLLGEASHGTHEFYHARAQITERLIREKGFTAVAAEADWPDAYRVNRFVRGEGRDADAASALGDFKRFPGRMWRNQDVVRFVEWLRAHNAEVTPPARAGFYGLDLYSLHTSMEAVLAFLDQADPAAAREARERYGCFDRFGDDTQAYGLMSGIGGMASCEPEVVRQLVELRRVAADYVRRDGVAAQDEAFFAEQNARLVKNAEEYYRSMFHHGVSTWNMRDRHMMETLAALRAHLGGAKAVVWAHNSHLGDPRATEMGRRGELNLGQLVRERHGRAAVLVGFTTDHGFVTAASDWGAPAERKAVRPALRGSYESLFHALDVPRFLLRLRHEPGQPDILATPHLERAIGVIYLPRTERMSHYFRADLPQQFDAVLHFDATTAVVPLERSAQWEAGEVPETYPTGV
jgi:erythromycin esterase-like protein